MECRYTNGSSRFRFSLSEPGSALRLRRTFNAAYGIPGERVSAPPAEVRVNGVLAGMFPPAASNPARRWQQQEILLAALPPAGDVAIAVTPLFSVEADSFGESAWALRGAWVDHIFRATFDGPGGPSRMR
jgi:hypothetical protein